MDIGELELLFDKKKRHRPARMGVQPEPLTRPLSQETRRIDFDMMLKGSVYERRNGPIRQFGVTVDGATRIVSSGDTVDSETYDALVAAGAIVGEAPIDLEPIEPAEAPPEDPSEDQEEAV